MNLAKLASLIVAAALLSACASTPAQNHAKSAVVHSSCGQSAAVINSPAAYVVEGFDGGNNTQLFVSQHSPITRCGEGLPAPSAGAKIGSR